VLLLQPHLLRARLQQLIKLKVSPRLLYEILKQENGNPWLDGPSAFIQDLEKLKK